MVVGCVECKRWEEDMYWSRFKAVQFCQFLSGRFDQHLAIPEKFADNLKEKLSGKVALKGPSGQVWDVGLVMNGDTLLLKDGWKEFVEDHSLQENDILVFKYYGDSRFDVLMFDQDSLCEKASTYFVKKCKHAEAGSSRGKRVGTPEEALDEPNDANHESFGDDVSNHRLTKRLRGDVARTPTLRVQPARVTSTSKSRRVTKRGRRSSKVPSRFHLKSRRRAVSKEERDRAQQIAVAASSDTSFIVVMRASHVYSGFFMSIPADWARKHLPHRSLELELRANGNSWKAKYQYKGYGGGLTGGWKTFVMENFLEEYDVCLFDCVAGTPEDAIVLDIKIFRVVEEVIPPSVVAPTPVSIRGVGNKQLSKTSSDSSEAGNEE